LLQERKSQIAIGKLACESSENCSKCAVNLQNKSKTLSNINNLACNSIGICSKCYINLQSRSKTSQAVQQAETQNDENAESSCDSMNLCVECANAKHPCEKSYRLTTFVHATSDTDDFLPPCESIDVCDDCGQVKKNSSKPVANLAMEEQRDSCDSLGNCSKCQLIPMKRATKLMKMTTRLHKICIKTVFLP
jgi:hypothetical protein